MNGYDAYQQYIAIKNHFSLDTYDYFHYKGKANTNFKSYEKRNDRYQFEKLAQKEDVHGILLSNLSIDPTIWVGNFLTDTRNYLQWKKVNESLSYTFKEDLKKFNSDFQSNFTSDGEYPNALKLFMRKEIARETLIILNNIIGFTPYWNKQINDEVLWPKIFFNLKKYSGFVDVDLTKYKDILIKTVNENEI